MSDELTGIFDNLEPNDFILDTSAIDETSGQFVGSTAFDAHIDEKIRTIKVALPASGGNFNPMAFLSNATTTRAFAGQQDENLGMFLERLKREARAMGATWFFFAKKNVIVRSYDEDLDTPDVTDPEYKQRMLQSEDAIEEVCILWYADRREGSEIQHRQGLLALNDLGTQVTQTIEGDERQTISVFAGILDAVIRS